MRRVSKKRAKLNVERKRLMEEHFGPREEWGCTFRYYLPFPHDPSPCFGSVNGHEIVKRSQGGSLTDLDNIVLLCNRHNDYLEDHPREARELGLVRSNWEV